VARLVRPSETLAQSANPPASVASGAPSGRPFEMSGMVPSMAAIA
jgi:hypothetical protein